MQPKALLWLALAVLCLNTPAQAQRKKKNASNQTTVENTPANTIAGKTSGMTKKEGFFTFYWDEEKGKIWLEINKWDQEFLYVNSLPAGLGSNDIGLDRGQLGGDLVGDVDGIRSFHVSKAVVFVSAQTTAIRHMCWVRR